MPTIYQLLDEYGESHQNATNKMIHWICVPIIFFTIYALLQSIRLTSDHELGAFFNVGNIALALALIYYFIKSKYLFVGFLIWSLLIWYVSNLWYMNTDTNSFLITMAVLFVVAWIFQFYGHKVEGKKPSFFKDLQFLLIGPAWLLQFIYKSLGLKI
ncbi:MAG: DUF962 domain-containing protein [Saprospiraceae bacterium]|nr:DUF962 domain-containing protein [Saprospiraceae bacterium]